MNRKSIILLFLSASILCSCNKSESGKESAKPIVVQTITMQMTEGAGTRTYIGEVQAAKGIPLYHPLGGKLTALHVRNGQKVSQGQIIADFDDTQARSMHDAAVATLNQAEDGYNRLLQVHEQGGLSDVKWIEMQTDLEKARQQEIATRKSLDDCHLKAPIDGVVTDAEVHAGQQLYPGQTVCSILSLNVLQAVFSVPESDISSFSLGDTITLNINALPNQSFRGIVLEKGLSAGMVAHTYQIKATILSPNRDILPGMLLKALTTKSFAAGLVVPSACVQTTPEGPSVWVVDNGVAHRRLVGTTQFVREGVLVSTGLNVGDKVVTSGYQKLFNGAQVVEAE